MDRSIGCSGIRVSGLSAAVPKQSQDNLNLQGISEEERYELVEKIGIRYRRIATSGQTASDLCEAASRAILEKLGWNVEDIGLLVFVTQTPDHLIPGTAPALVHRLGINPNCMALDINQGCSGYVNGLAVATGLMKSYGISKGLLLVGDTITKTISDQDLSLVPIFSDAGSATALELDDGAPAIQFLMGNIGSDAEAIYIPDGGGRNPLDPSSLKQEMINEHVTRSKANLAMEGKDVFTFGLTKVPASISKLLELTGTETSEIDQLVLHQANQFLSDLISKKVGVDRAKTPSSLFDFGNTSCATIPVTLVSQLKRSLESERLKLLLSGFGVGLSWANAIIETESVVCTEILEV